MIVGVYVPLVDAVVVALNVPLASATTTREPVPARDDIVIAPVDAIDNLLTSLYIKSNDVVVEIIPPCSVVAAPLKNLIVPISSLLPNIEIPLAAASMDLTVNCPFVLVVPTDTLLLNFPLPVTFNAVLPSSVAPFTLRRDENVADEFFIINCRFLLTPPPVV